jgi:hypothetical protein
MLERQEITLDAANIRDDHGEDVARVVVENEKGEKAIVFVTVQMVHGRPRFALIAKKNKGIETEVRATPDWRL